MTKLLTLCLFATAATAFAQLPPSTTSDTSVVSTRSYVVEWVIVVVMIGLALYELCRPGRRHQS